MEALYQIDRNSINTDHLKKKLIQILRNTTDVEDVIQDTYVRLLEFQKSNNQIDNIPAFFYRVAHNIAIDRIRRRYRTDRIFVASDEDGDIRSELLQISCPQPRADHSLESKRALDAVLAAIAELPPKCGRAYLLSCADQFTYAEIAVEIGVTVSMIEKYVARARRHVRETVSPMYHLNS